MNHMSDAAAPDLTRPSLSVVAPCYNEAEVSGILFRTIPARGRLVAIRGWRLITSWGRLNIIIHPEPGPITSDSDIIAEPAKVQFTPSFLPDFWGARGMGSLGLRQVKGYRRRRR
jgi:hypothetical protein